MRATCRTCHAEYSGRMEHCPACHNTFTGTTAGDMHRVGPGHARRCLTEAEMLDKGMGIDGRGRWKSSDEPWDTARRLAGSNLSASQPEPGHGDQDEGYDAYTAHEWATETARYPGHPDDMIAARRYLDRANLDRKDHHD